MIDINVSKTVEVVEINVTENLTTVNINTKTGAFDAYTTAQTDALLSAKEPTSNKSISTSDSASSVKFPVWSAILSYFSTSRIKTILGQASASVDGWLSASDWNTFNSKVAYKSKPTYALMIADGTPSVPTIYSITNDENKSYERSTYLWKPDGKREWIATTPDN